MSSVAGARSGVSGGGFPQLGELHLATELELAYTSLLKRGADSLGKTALQHQQHPSSEQSQTYAIPLPAGPPAGLTNDAGAHFLYQLRRHVDQHPWGQHASQHRAQAAEGVQQLLHRAPAPATVEEPLDWSCSYGGAKVTEIARRRGAASRQAHMCKSAGMPAMAQQQPSCRRT